MKNFNQIWDTIFNERNPSKYPFDNVVSFLFRNYPKDKPKSEIKILEVGCGGGNNLWFAAKEGFRVYGIDGSAKAIEIVNQRFLKEDLKGEFIHGDFSDLPYNTSFFDIVIDRCSIVCVDKLISKKVFSDICRVLKPNGLFFFNPYSDQHTSCLSGELLENGITENIKEGSLVGNGSLSFYNKNELIEAFTSPWSIEQLKLKTHTDELSNANDIHAEWELILRKNG